jgi:hypothetical protein
MNAHESVNQFIGKKHYLSGHRTLSEFDMMAVFRPFANAIE